MNSTKKPLLSVASKPSIVRKSFGLPSNVAERIEGYAEFLTEIVEKPYKGADIISTLTEQLEKDKMFVKWRIDKANAASNEKPEAK